MKVDDGCDGCRVQKFLDSTPGKINMEPENRPLEEENHLPKHHFQVRFDNLRGCRFCGVFPMT